MAATAMPRDDAHDAALDPRTMTPVWYARETRLAHMLPYVSLVDVETVRTRVNELFRCIRLEGINSYTTDDSYCQRRRQNRPRGGAKPGQRWRPRAMARALDA